MNGDKRKMIIQPGDTGDLERYPVPGGHAISYPIPKDYKLVPDAWERASLKKEDAAPVREMRRLLVREIARSIYAAAKMVAPGATGYGTIEFESTVRRLVERYKKVYNDESIV